MAFSDYLVVFYGHLVVEVWDQFRPFLGDMELF
jgi:hypothetical protein